MRKLLTILCLLTLTFVSKAQEPQITQKFNNVLYLNPALTGNGDKLNRLTFFYRDQWRSVIVPYSSVFFSYDRKLFNKNNNQLGVGINLFNDKVGDGSLNTFHPNVSLSYTRLFNLERHGLSFGAEFGYMQRRINQNKLQFDSQFGIDGFDPDLSNNENFNNTAGAPTMRFGINFMTKMGKRSKWNFGADVTNPHQPNVSFTNNDEDNRPVKYSTYLLAELFFAKKWSITPSFNFQTQEQARETHLTGIFNYYSSLGDLPVRWSMGGGYRVKDAALAYVGAKIGDLLVGFSYDVNTSSFTDATNYKGGFEIGLNYEFERKRAIEEEELVEIDTVVIEEEEETEEEEEKEIKVPVYPPIDPPIIPYTEYVAPEPKEDIVVVPQELDKINNLLPVRLFFDNDHPNPNTYKGTTNLNYETTYNAYKTNKNSFTNSIGVESANNWFAEVDKGMQNLEMVLNELKPLLTKGNAIKITLKGYTSPLAPSQYNTMLSMRRIESIILYIKKYDNRFFENYINNGQLIFVKNPFGEEFAPIEVSDNSSDRKASIYDPKASYERRIEMIAVELND